MRQASQLLRLGAAASALMLATCAEPLLVGDRLDLESGAAALAQGLASDGCHRDLAAGTGGFVSVRDFVGSHQDCPAEVAIFAVDRSAEFARPAWSAGMNEVRATRADPSPLSIEIRVAALPYATQVQTDASCRRAEADVARAHQVYNTMRCGIVFTSRIQTVDLSHNWGVLYAGCALADTLKADAGYSPGALNVYYIVGSNGDKGIWCGNDVLIVTTLSDNETLSHEIGHALSLDHYPLATENIMVSGTPVRNVFTLGQCFRCNFNPASPLGAGQTAGTTNCPPEARDNRCPEVWWPDAPPPVPPPGLTPDPVRRWLECEECGPAELEPVVALRDGAIKALREGLADLQNPVRTHLQTTYRGLKSYCVPRPAVPFQITEEAYIAGYLANARARYQLRAAVAARQISTPAARALVQELRTTARPDVRGFITRVLQ